jgi:hypothetical protein
VKCWSRAGYSTLTALVVGNLSTRPEYQHKGIAVKLIKCFLAESDRTNHSVYLDASPAGLPLYSFEEVGSMGIDLGSYSGSGIHRHIGMRRYPKAAECKNSNPCKQGSESSSS